MLARLLVWFALFTYIFLCVLHISLPHTYNFEKKLRGKCFPFIILSCFCWSAIQQSSCRMNISALAMELRAFRQPSVSETGAGSVMPLLDQHVSPGAEPLPGWDAWAPGLLSPFPPTAWTGRFCHCPWPFMSFPGDLDNEESACNAGDPGSIPGWERSPGEGNGYPLQYSCLENPTDRGAWQAALHGVAKSWTQLSDYHFDPS